ncbi:alpha/beta-hydrolase [Mycena haematopus]|nr:alpha/beta-hydrolase [Mycena haematopus]
MSTGLTPSEKHTSLYPTPYGVSFIQAMAPGYLNRSRVLGWVLLVSIIGFFVIGGSPAAQDPFYSKVSLVNGICPGVRNETVSYAGHIGLNSDSPHSPKRSFFWYFEAEDDAVNAPIILTVGGGPGTSGMMNPLFGQAPCIVTADGLVPNPHRWTEHHNLIALDHPIGVGFSFGSRVNSSRAAAYDVYDFLQKFFVLFPHLARNKFIVSGGSYGGVYVPHIATVIQEQNMLIAADQGRKGAIPINLDALILSNPFSDPTSHFRWLLHYRCMDHQLFNETDCRRLYSELPTCLDSIDLALEIPTVENRVKARTLCNQLNNADPHGIVFEDIRRTCIPEDEAPDACHPQFRWVEAIFRNASIKDTMRIPQELNYTALNMDINTEFHAAGDAIQPHHLLYVPLLEAGVRVLHYIGAQDANCAWLGVFSFLKLLPTTFQKQFLSAPDVPWPAINATVRSVGKGAGNMTFILLAEAGHFVVGDQPVLAKLITEKWIANQPFLETQDAIRVLSY